MQSATRIAIQKPRIVLYLGDVAYFLKDMAKDVEWMLHAACANVLVPLRGDEVIDCEVQLLSSSSPSNCAGGFDILEDAAPRKQCTICKHDLLQDSFSKSQWGGNAKSRKCIKCIEASNAILGRRGICSRLGEFADGGKFLITFALWKSADHELLARLEKAPCRQGYIQLFPFSCCGDSVPEPCELWSAYRSHALMQWPQFGTILGSTAEIVRNSVIIPVYSFRGKHYFLNVFMPKEKRWGFVGADVSFGVDATWGHATSREWWEEVGASLNTAWDDVFTLPETELLNAFGDRLHHGCLSNNNAFLHTVLDTSRFRQPITAYFFVQVRPTFFKQTQDIRELPNPAVMHVRWGQLYDAELVKQVHTEGALFVEHSEICWLTVAEYRARKAPDGRRIWAPDVQFMKSRFGSNWWHWLQQCQGRVN